MNGLEDFDDFQGEDPVLLKMREKVPEPSTTEYPLINAIRPIETPVNWSQFGDFDCKFESRATETFEKVWMITRGKTKFSAWKSTRDGKIYI